MSEEIDELYRKQKMIVTFEVTKSQALALQTMFETWNSMGRRGCSRDVAFRVDGDGNFQPNCEIVHQAPIEDLTDEIRYLARYRSRDCEFSYDFNAILGLQLQNVNQK